MGGDYAGLDESWEEMRARLQVMDDPAIPREELPVLMVTLGLDKLWPPELCSEVPKRFPLTNKVSKEGWTHWCLGQQDVVEDVGVCIVLWLETLPSALETVILEDANRQSEETGEQGIYFVKKEPASGFGDDFTLVSPERLLLKIKDITARTLGVESCAINAGSSFAEMGLDSIAASQLVGSFSDSLGIDVTPAIFYDHPTVGALVKHISNIVIGTRGQELASEGNGDYMQVVAEIRAVLAEILGLDVPEIAMGTPFVDMGLDSLTTAQIVRDLKERLQVELTSAVLFDFPTIDSLALHIHGKTIDFRQDPVTEKHNFASLMVRKMPREQWDLLDLDLREKTFLDATLQPAKHRAGRWFAG